MLEKLKNNKLLLTIAIVGMALIITGVAYAFFEANLLGIREHTIEVGESLVFEYNEADSGLSLDVSDVLSDSDGKTNNKYFDFEVSLQTESETEVDYYIYLTKDESSTLDDSKIKLYLTDQNDTLIIDTTSVSNLGVHQEEANSYYIYGTNISSTNNTKVTHNYRLRVWIDENMKSITNSNGIHEINYGEGTYKFKVNVATGEMPLDTSGANAPALATGMIPVYYDGETWRKADSTNTNATYKWYNYDEKMWANAVTVTESNGSRNDLVNAPNGTEIPMSRINTMMVWIPRFSATSNGSYNGGTKVSPGAFNITFVDKNTNAHDSFTFGTQELSGFWISKFEASTGTTNCAPADSSAIGEGCNVTTINPYVVPNVTSWRGAMVSTYYRTMLEMKTETSIYGFDVTIDETLDTHMIKNSEWGAVAYLTQSIYGRCTSSTACTEVGRNNNSSYLTGYGAPAGSYDTVTNGAYNTTLGMDASTTGNIYGVYDMSGGANDYVMGVYWDGNRYWSGYQSTTDYPNRHSGFNGCLGSACPSSITNGLAYPSDRKYFNLYTNTGNSSTPITDYTSSELQHAMTETKNWYVDTAIFVFANSPWVDRGGDYDEGPEAGVFNYRNYYGVANPGISSRLSLTIN